MLVVSLHSRSSDNTAVQKPSFGEVECLKDVRGIVSWINTALFLSCQLIFKNDFCSACLVFSYSSIILRIHFGSNVVSDLNNTYVAAINALILAMSEMHNVVEVAKCNFLQHSKIYEARASVWCPTIFCLSLILESLNHLSEKRGEQYTFTTCWYDVAKRFQVLQHGWCDYNALISNNFFPII